MLMFLSWNKHIPMDVTFQIHTIDTVLCVSFPALTGKKKTPKKHHTMMTMGFKLKRELIWYVVGLANSQKELSDDGTEFWSQIKSDNFAEEWVTIGGMLLELWKNGKTGRKYSNVCDSQWKCCGFGPKFVGYILVWILHYQNSFPPPILPPWHSKGCSISHGFLCIVLSNSNK